MKLFEASQMEAIARALGDTDDGLTNDEISQLFGNARIPDPGPGTKWKRIYNGFVTVQNQKRNRTNILEFIRGALNPARYVRQQARFETMRRNVNRALAFCGLSVGESGKISKVAAAATISDAKSRAEHLYSDLKDRGVHPDVLEFCREELLQDNYFHAVLEAVKSVSAKIRSKSGLTDDGAALVDRALTGDPPLLAINPLTTESEKSEQRGFANLVKGTFGMFRNPTAHEAKIYWRMNEADAVDLMSLVSLVHRRLDESHMPPRV
ncbi:MAG: TIGR02391 family protein [Caulobacterales bacterium]|nr:TIGR02391 family protein [Caulobacterales bacterium]